MPVLRATGPEAGAEDRARSIRGRIARPQAAPAQDADARPYATGALIVVALLATIVTSTGRLTNFDLGGLYGPVGGEWWRLVTTPFVYSNGGYEFVALVAVGVFGTLVERRFGPVAALVLFLAAGAGGAALAYGLNDFPVLGGNGAALGLLTAWLVDDRLSARRGTDRENDLLGVYVFAVLLLLIPVAEEDASFYAGLGGAGVGAVVGAAISPFRP